MANKIVFVDDETTGLDPLRNDVWEIAAIVRETGIPDVEHCWMVCPDLRTADPNALRINRYYQRTAGRRLTTTGNAIITAGPDEGLPAGEYLTTASQIAAELARLLDGATLAGACPAFDAAFLSVWLRQHGQAPAWRHRLLDVEALAAGARRESGHLRGLRDLAASWDVQCRAEDVHTALGDARMARDLYDAIMSGRRPSCDTVQAGR
jgi:DNA polymerase III epsilon subunit-like protein